MINCPAPAAAACRKHTTDATAIRPTAPVHNPETLNMSSFSFAGHIRGPQQGGRERGLVFLLVVAYSIKSRRSNELRLPIAGRADADPPS